MYQQLATSAFLIFSLIQTTVQAAPAEALTTTTAPSFSLSASSSFDPYGTSSYSSIDPLSGLFSDFDPFTSTAASSILAGLKSFTDEYASRVSPINNEFYSAYETATGIDQIIVLSSYSSALSTAVRDDTSFFGEFVHYYSIAGLLTGSGSDSGLVASQTVDDSGYLFASASASASGYASVDSGAVSGGSSGSGVASLTGSEEIESVSSTVSGSGFQSSESKSNDKASSEKSGSSSATASDSSSSASSSGLAGSVAPVASTFGLLSIGFIALLL
ncbi:unnamed protein product [Ambrosiozyma monospora]|uniref:Unnamed protein product n=1 Tax=Ambrosiozyma monospora TaxID=43982 RepID=A0ACB5TXS8_AMBMO|nr:unnamed protein product [Ambrosiozyma monospora]